MKVTSNQKPETRIYNGTDKLFLWLLVASLWLLTGCFLFAQDLQTVAAEAVFDKAEITIGEKVKYVITVEAPNDIKIDFPVIDSMLANAGFAVRDFGEDKPVKVKKDRIRIKHWYLLDTYITGSYNIPAVNINYTLSDGTKGNVQTKDVFLNVKSVIKEGEKAEDIRDIKQPVEIKVNYKKLVIWTTLSVLAITIVVSGIIIFKKHRHLIIPAPPPMPPYVIALRELEKIKELPINEYYIAISGIIRHYIENRFSLHAPERTTEEFLSELTGTEVLIKEHKYLLKEFLRHCDLVKFARYGPTKEEIDGVYNTARKFIEETAGRKVTGGY